MALAKPRWVIFKGEDKDWHFHLQARNGQIIVASEGYKNRIDLLSTLKSLAEILSEDTEVVELATNQ